jgi:hypothetical protein
MDWKLKYLKYKTKYINLKSKFENTNLSNYDNNDNNINNSNDNIINNSTDINYFNKLKELYPNCVKKSSETNETTHTYGEMEYNGVENLNKQINYDSKIKYFLDIGSGRGKLPCWFAGIAGIIKSIGIEIVEQRCLDANKLKSDLAKNFPNQTYKIELLCGGFENYDLGEMVESNPDTLVWISNLCFGHELTEKVFTQIINQMVKGTIICCSRQPSESVDLNTSNKLVYKNKIQIQMSWWDKLSDVYVYQIK